MILLCSKCETVRARSWAKKQFRLSNSKNIPRKIKTLVGKETRGLGQQSDQRLFCLFIGPHLERQRKRSKTLFSICSKFAHTFQLYHKYGLVANVDFTYYFVNAQVISSKLKSLRQKTDNVLKKTDALQKNLPSEVSDFILIIANPNTLIPTS